MPGYLDGRLCVAVLAKRRLSFSSALIFAELAEPFTKALDSQTKCDTCYQQDRYGKTI